MYLPLVPLPSFMANISWLAKWHSMPIISALVCGFGATMFLIETIFILRGSIPSSSRSDLKLWLAVALGGILVLVFGIYPFLILVGLLTLCLVVGILYVFFRGLQIAFGKE